MAIQIHKAGVRDALTPRPGPYWATPVLAGLYVGYRKHKNGTGSWIARWRGEDGRQQYNALGRASPSFGYSEALEAARAWHKLLEAGIDAAEVDTVLDACNAYVRWLEDNNRGRTAVDARKRVERYIKPMPLASIKLSKLRTQHIEEWRNANRSRGRVETLSPASLNRLLTTLKAALNLAVKRRQVAPDRAVEWGDVAALDGAGRRELFLDLSQRRALLAELSGGARDLAEAVMLTGARAGELTSARRSQFDARSGSMTFNGKTGTRTVPLAPAACALFARLARDKLPAAPLFVRDDGMPWIRRGAWAEKINAAAASAGLPPERCLYTLRHSFITEAITSGMSPLEVARLVGTSLSMIDRHYGHLAAHSARERLAAVNFT